jgi:hypothetical protein
MGPYIVDEGNAARGATALQEEFDGCQLVAHEDAEIVDAGIDVELRMHAGPVLSLSHPT